MKQCGLKIETALFVIFVTDRFAGYESYRTGCHSKRVEESTHYQLRIKDIGREDPSSTHLRCFAQDDTVVRYILLSKVNSNLLHLLCDSSNAIVFS